MGWVKVTEWLPEDNKWVYAYKEHGGIHEVLCIETRMMPLADFKGRGVPVKTWVDRYGNTCFPTHWTTLKDPPMHTEEPD